MLEEIELRCSWADVTATIEPCIDDAGLWAWAIVVDGGEFDSSYAGSREEAIANARSRWQDRLAEVEG